MTSRDAADWPALLVQLAILLVATWVALHLNPTGFGGGPFDDQRYFDAAHAWLAHPPLVGRTHWELRHTLILPLAALFRLKGETIAAGLLLPMAASLLFAAVNFTAIRQAAGGRVAWIWAAFFLTMPLFLRIGTSIFPEIVELLFGSCALWALWFGRRARFPARLFAISGFCAALAIMTRETAAWLVPVYAVCLIFRPGVRRIAYVRIALFAAVPLLIEYAWLAWETGDPLYRLHIGMRHVLIPSANMAGGVVHVDHVLFNPAVAKAWVPPGLFHVDWALNPLLGLFADPKYGLAIWGAVLFAFLPTRRGRGRAGLIPPLLAIAALSFGFVTYVLMVSQDQRYYATPLYCIALIAAVLGDRACSAGRPVLVAVVTIAIVVTNIALALQFGRFDDVASVAMPLVGAGTGPISADPTVAAQLRQPLAEAGLSGRVMAGHPAPGGLALIVEPGRRDCTVGLRPGQRLIGCRISRPPFLVRWISRTIPRLPMPDKAQGGTRAVLVRYGMTR